MFTPTITKEWLLATMELEGDGFCNAGGIREKCEDEIDGAMETTADPFRQPEEVSLDTSAQGLLVVN